MAGPLVTFLTDFGMADAYVGAMKGVMLQINPQISIVDLTHNVSPQNVLEGAFLLSTAWHYFPTATIHISVIDPGVGTDRKALLLEGHGHLFLAPDNGLFSFVLPPDDGTSPLFQPYVARLPEGFSVYELDNPSYWRHPVSATFHGRDIFAPVAAHLSLGVKAEEIGQPVDSITRLAVPIPHWQGDALLGHVLHIDRFGNIITNVLAEELPAAYGGKQVEVGGTEIPGLASSYAAGEGLVTLIGSHGYLEIALSNGSASGLLRVSVGDEVWVGKG